MQQKPKLNLRRQPDDVLNESGVRPNQRRRAVLISVGGVSIAAIVAGSYLLGQQNKDQQSLRSPVAVQGAQSISKPLKTFFSSELGLSLEFNQELIEEPLTDQDRADGFIARLTSLEPPVIISIRTESGLRTAAQITQTDIVTLLESSMEKALPSRFPEFSLDKSTSTTINGKGLIEKVFSYRGPGGEVAKQRLLTFIKDSDTAVYVSMQTTEALYDSVSVRYFDPLAGSISID